MLDSLPTERLPRLSAATAVSHDLPTEQLPVSRPVAPGPTRTDRSSRFRPELEGLRALAAGLVVVYHVWVGSVSGGVDVFFVISGFLLTGQLVRAAERGRVDPVGYWGKTFRRLLPTAAVVLVAASAAGIVLLPESRWTQTIREVVASALFFQNWRLAADSVDYYAAHNTASVVQHLWSLSLQGQFYLAFPLVIALAVVLARRYALRVTDLVAAALTLGFLASLTYSIVLTTADQKLAYFDSFTRLWEFLAGGLLALVIDRIALPAGVRAAVGWLGVLGLVSCGVLMDVGGAFPGYLALWPVGAASMVLLAGRSGHALAVDRILVSAPMQYLGKLSFSLYLWHWPVLLFALVLIGRPTPSLGEGVVIVAVALLLAAVTHRLVEGPMARSASARDPQAQMRAIATALIPVLLVAAGWQLLAWSRTETGAAVGDVDHPGAQSLVAGYVPQGRGDAALVPSAVSLREDWWADQGQCRYPGDVPDMKVCTIAPAGPPTRRILAVGDSHMQQFLPAITTDAAARGWEVTSILRGACPFALGPSIEDGQPACAAQNAAVLRTIRESRPDAVVVQASTNVRRGLTESTPEAFVDGWRAIAALGVPVLGVRDNPRFDASPTDCLESPGATVADCGVPREEFLAATAPYERPGVTVPETARFLDLSDLLCTPTTCPPAVGNVRVYLDNNHLSATYTRTLAPTVNDRIAGLLEW